MAKSAWMLHVAAFRKAHPGMKPKAVFGAAAKTFKKQSGGSAPSLLTPEAVSGGMRHSSSSGTALQMKANLYSGGKKRSAKKRSAKKRSAKRRH